MSWREQRRAAREVVHDTFKLRAWHYVTDDVRGDGNEISVRVHGRRVDTGDLDREGYGQVIESEERVILQLDDVQRFSITERQWIKLEDDRVFFLEAREPNNDDYTVTYRVSRA